MRINEKFHLTIPVVFRLYGKCFNKCASDLKEFHNNVELVTFSPWQTANKERKMMNPFGVENL